MISQRSMSQWSTFHKFRQSARFAIIGAAFAFLAVYPAGLGAQDTGASMPPAAQQAAGALTGAQQSAANSALCSTIGSQVPNPALLRRRT